MRRLPDCLVLLVVTASSAFAHADEIGDLRSEWFELRLKRERLQQEVVDLNAQLEAYEQFGEAIHEWFEGWVHFSEYIESTVDPLISISLGALDSVKEAHESWLAHADAVASATLGDILLEVEASTDLDSMTQIESAVISLKTQLGATGPRSRQRGSA